MKLTLNARVLNGVLPVGSARALAGAGRVLLALTVALLVTSPLTQHVWTWDHFLRGGQDYESSALLILTFLSLVLVLGQHCKQCVRTFFTVRRRYRSVVSDRPLCEMDRCVTFSHWLSECEASPGIVTYSLPLQI